MNRWRRRHQRGLSFPTGLWTVAAHSEPGSVRTCAPSPLASSACALATWCPPVASSVAIPRRSRSGRRRSPAEGRRRAPMAQAGHRHGTSGGGHARTATSARSPWCSAAVRWETVSTPGQPLRARAACTPRSSDAAARPHIPPLSGRGRARERAAHTSAAPAPRPAQAILFPPPAESLRRPLSPETGRCSARSQCRSSS